MAANTTSNVQQQGGVKTGITALAGGAAPSAAAQTLEAINVLSTVAAAGDSVILPAGMPQGTLITVQNKGVNRADVFPPTGGTINGGVATTGDFSVGVGKTARFVQTGIDGLTWIASVPNHGGVKTGITALAGGATPSAEANTLEQYNVIATCATAGDSVIIRAGHTFGTTLVVLNSGAAGADVFPPTSGTINGGTPTTGDFRVTNAKVGTFVCISDDGLTWHASLSA